MVPENQFFVLVEGPSAPRACHQPHHSITGHPPSPDVEMKTLDSGSSVAKFGLASNRKWKNKEGELKEEVTFVDVNVWGNMAQVCEKYLEKGRQVLVEGRLRLETWENDEGEKRNKHSILAENVQFISSKGDNSENEDDKPKPKPKKVSSKKSKPVQDDDFEDEVPF